MSYSIVKRESFRSTSLLPDEAHTNCCIKTNKPSQELRLYLKNGRIINDTIDSLNTSENCSCPDSKEYNLNKQIYLLQEELIRTKALLEQSQTNRARDLETMQRLQLKLEYFEKQIDSNKYTKDEELVRQITKLKAAEKELKQNFLKEKEKVSQLNEEIIRLNQKLQEKNELFNDSLDNNTTHTVHFKFETTASSPSNEFNNEKYETNDEYYDVLDKLKVYGFNSSSNYQDIIVHLYKQQANALNELSDLKFHLKQMQLNSDKPLDAIKNLFADLKAYKSEITYLTQNIDKLKTELKLQHEANLSNNEYILKRNYIDGKLLEDKPMYKSTAEFVKTKVVTLPSCESFRPIYAVETEGIVEEKVFYNDKEDKKEVKQNKKDEAKTEETKSTASEDFKKEQAEEKDKSKQELENTLRKTIDTLNDVNTEKTKIESQLANTLAELKTSQNENTILISKHEQQVKFLNDQLQAFQTETSKVREENNELRITQAKNNSELTQVVQNYEEKIKKLEKQFTKAKEEYDSIKDQYDKLLFRYNQEFTEITKKHSQEVASKNQKHSSDLNTMQNELAKARAECENYKIESEKFLKDLHETKHKLSKTKEENKRKIEHYELEIINLNKELTKMKVEFQNTQLDFSLKCDEATRLQRLVDEMIDLKERYNLCEQKLCTQEKNNLIMKEKLAQLQNDLLNKDQDYMLATHLKNIKINNSEELRSSQDIIIDNLKSTIQEQFALRNASAQSDIEDLKFRIHELSMKLSQEKLLNESLEIRCKLIDQDNQSLRKALLNHSRKFTTTERANKNRIEEINEIIEKAQKNAKNIIASNPNMSNYFEIKNDIKITN